MRPNFFIAGAPKSGTTALYEYLRSHPDICMPDGKEPHYFATDFADYPRITTEQDYLALFRKCGLHCSAVGEASVWYLYSDEALENIRSFEPEAKIIAMLRNPVDLVHSMHAQALYNFNEDETDFETAWSLQDERRQGRHIPPGCRAQQILQYQALGSLGQQVERLYRIFPPEQILLLFFDDFVSNTQAVYERVLGFLGVLPDGRAVFPTVNAARTHRSRLLGWLTQTPPGPLLGAVRFMRKHMGVEINPLLARIRRLNDTPAQAVPLDPDFRRHLQNVFTDDIHLLERCSGRSLARWLA